MRFGNSTLHSIGRLEDDHIFILDSDALGPSRSIFDPSCIIIETKDLNNTIEKYYPTALFYESRTTLATSMNKVLVTTQTVAKSGRQCHSVTDIILLIRFRSKRPKLAINETRPRF